jgi:hypothetical protein
LSALIRVLTALVALPACTLLTDPWEYTEVSLGPALDRLAPECGACIESQCPDLYEQCALEPGCVNYATCVTANPSPAGRYACSDENKSYRRLLDECRACSHGCRFGRNWDCSGRYALESVGATSVSWSQRLLDNAFLGGRRPFAGVTVRACSLPGFACGPAVSAEPNPALEDDLLTWTETDADGWFTLELPVDPDSGGFRGVLVANGPEIPTFRLYHTTPRNSGRSETELLSLASRSYVHAFAALTPTDAAHADVLFQVNDCIGRPAPDVVAVPTNGDTPRILYVTDISGGLPNPQATTAEGRGIGALFSLDPSISASNAPGTNGYVPLEFWQGDSLINKDGVPIVAGETSVLQVGPTSSGQVEP